MDLIGPVLRVPSPASHRIEKPHIAGGPIASRSGVLGAQPVTRRTYAPHLLGTVDRNELNRGGGWCFYTPVDLQQRLPFFPCCMHRQSSRLSLLVDPPPDLALGSRDLLPRSLGPFLGRAPDPLVIILVRRLGGASLVPLRCDVCIMRRRPLVIRKVRRINVLSIARWVSRRVGRLAPVLLPARAKCLGLSLRVERCRCRRRAALRLRRWLDGQAHLYRVSHARKLRRRGRFWRMILLAGFRWRG